MTEAASFTIFGTLPSLNEYVFACRTNARVGAAMKRDVEATIVSYARCRRLQPVASPVFVKFAWHEPDLRRDADNVAFAKKMILDALVTIGVLQGDGRRHVVGFSDEFPPPDRLNPRIVVTIERTPAWPA